MGGKSEEEEEDDDDDDDDESAEVANGNDTERLCKRALERPIMLDVCTRSGCCATHEQRRSESTLGVLLTSSVKREVRVAFFC